MNDMEDEIDADEAEESTIEGGFDDEGFDEDDESVSDDSEPSGDPGQGRWREKFVEICLRLFNNDETLVNLDDASNEGLAVFRRRKWSDTDLILLGRALQCNTFLSSLRIETNICLRDKTVSLSGFDALRQGIAKSQLRKLALKDLCYEMREIVLQGVEKSSTLQCLKFSKMKMDIPDMLTRVVEAPTLIHLVLSRIDNFTHHDLQAMSLCLSNNHLLSLSLVDNDITDYGVTTFCEHWSDDSPLKELILNHNSIGWRGAQTLMKAVARHSAMEMLLLNENRASEYQFLQVVGEFLPRCGLQHLEIAKCVNFKTVSTPQARGQACQALADGLRSNTSLRVLSVGGNNLGDSGVQMLMQAVAVHPNLQSLSLVRDRSVGLSGLRQLGVELRQVRLREIKLDGLFSRMRCPKNRKHAQDAGFTLLEAVKNNAHLQSFVFDGLDCEWMDPIQFYVSLNIIYRPLLRSAAVTSSLWPHVLSFYDRHNKISHIYLSLREQPWLASG